MKPLVALSLVAILALPGLAETPQEKIERIAGQSLPAAAPVPGAHEIAPDIQSISYLEKDMLSQGDWKIDRRVHETIGADYKDNVHVLSWTNTRWLELNKRHKVVFASPKGDSDLASGSFIVCPKPKGFKDDGQYKEEEIVGFQHYIAVQVGRSSFFYDVLKRDPDNKALLAKVADIDTAGFSLSDSNLLRDAMILSHLNDIETAVVNAGKVGQKPEAKKSGYSITYAPKNSQQRGSGKVYMVVAGIGTVEIWPKLDYGPDPNK